MAAKKPCWISQSFPRHLRIRYFCGNIEDFLAWKGKTQDDVVADDFGVVYPAQLRKSYYTGNRLHLPLMSSFFYLSNTWKPNIKHPGFLPLAALFYNIISLNQIKSNYGVIILSNLYSLFHLPCYGFIYYK